MPSETLQEAFVANGDDPIRLLAQGNRVTAGRTISVAVDNRTDSPVLYGTDATLDDPDSGEPVAGSQTAFLSVGLYADPGEVGPCVLIDVPDETPSGVYLASLRGVDIDELELPVRVEARPGA